MKRTVKAPWTTYLRGTPKQRGEMNRLEAAWADELRKRELAGEVLFWAYEAITLRLTESTADGKPGIRYTPDFLVMLADGLLECHELKGFRNTADVNRVKAAADKFPFRFLLIERGAKNAGWKIEEL